MGKAGLAIKDGRDAACDDVTNTSAIQRPNEQQKLFTFGHEEIFRGPQSGPAHPTTPGVACAPPRLLFPWPSNTTALPTPDAAGRTSCQKCRSAGALVDWQEASFFRAP